MKISCRNEISRDKLNFNLRWNVVASHVSLATILGDVSHPSGQTITPSLGKHSLLTCVSLTSDYDRCSRHIQATVVEMAAATLT